MSKRVCRNTVLADALKRAGIGPQFPKNPVKVDSLPVNLARRDRALSTLRQLAERTVDEESYVRAASA